MKFAHTIRDWTTGYGRAAEAIIKNYPNISVVDDNSDIVLSPPHIAKRAPVLYTMYESSLVPAEWIAQINKERKLLIVTCQQNVEAFKNSGCKLPIKVCPFGVNRSYFPPVEFHPFTFLHVATDSGCPERKRSAEVVEAFVSEFKTESDVRLIVKKTKDCQRIPCYDSRVELIYGDLSEQELLHLYRISHVGVFISGQEGWSYPIHEMIAIGRPVITPIYGGPAQFLNKSFAYSLPYTMKSVPQTFYRGLGLRAYPSVVALRRVMRNVYQDKVDTVLKGAIAYRASLGFTIEQSIARLKEIYDEYILSCGRHGRYNLEYSDNSKNGERHTSAWNGTWTMEKAKRRNNKKMLSIHIPTNGKIRGQVAAC